MLSARASAAGSDAAVVLVDITKLDVKAAEVTLLPQTRRHSLLARLLRVPSIVFAVNKLDAVADPGPAFEAVSAALSAFAQEAGIEVAGIDIPDIDTPGVIASVAPAVALLEELAAPQAARVRVRPSAEMAVML